ncbi:uncharacterized protein LOC134845117 [Symsagittifera roscoffensis]|uniref:uncharacterized protein LOC134845117 n=1 Tax=Symsagittifera roscoffensis TaxID=84072 RepID=UPI00307CA6B9
MIMKTLACSLFVFAFVLGFAHGEYGCSRDEECEWMDKYVHLAEDVGHKCCSDDKCREICSKDILMFVLFFLIIPIVGCLLIATFVGLIVCCVLKNQKSKNTSSGKYRAGGPPPTLSQSPKEATSPPARQMSQPPPYESGASERHSAESTSNPGA